MKLLALRALYSMGLIYTSTKPPVARSETFNKLSHNKSYIEL